MKPCGLAFMKSRFDAKFGQDAPIRLYCDVVRDPLNR